MSYYSLKKRSFFETVIAKSIFFVKSHCGKSSSGFTGDFFFKTFLYYFKNVFWLNHYFFLKTLISFSLFLFNKTVFFNRLIGTWMWINEKATLECILLVSFNHFFFGGKIGKDYFEWKHLFWLNNKETTKFHIFPFKARPIAGSRHTVTSVSWSY